MFFTMPMVKRKKNVPIHERFENGSVPQGWGQQTFIAVPNTKEGLYARHQGPCGNKQEIDKQRQPNVCHTTA